MMRSRAIALAALVFQETNFRNLLTQITGALQNMTGPLKRFFLKVMEQVCAFFFIILPDFSPFSSKVSAVASSYRAMGTDWLYLACILGDTCIFTAFSYFVSVYFFKRKRYN